MTAGYWTFGPLQHQRHTDWRCSTFAWRRGKWRPVVHVRFGRASQPAFGLFIGRDEDEQWEMHVAVIKADVMATLTGPWG